MKHVYTLYDPLLAGHLEQVLGQSGIRCMIKNKHLMGGVGDLPPIEAWPEIWVLHDGDATSARALIESIVEHRGNGGSSWVCETCGETMEPQFSECWNCASPSASFTA